ncbi:hypothetical protein ABB37_04775 [Leptomonas pyrrhocoris]|uniref:J domain-containing protein n=1 Tax=Leptomonas pyrrhocoris TaxID=157538 RepID=A0A0M9G1R0_LEPPY|nr:hypothetical protein ABB37_04775 [Leptomonas pyrrhocoris]KPA80575.1 hypothetical protein ABB37_04775 [Leptomonas pyrrhocoris]|eukprot:XP_015659014.1 hypothetical protein ABB37_04775 [Leptomonas pyrrhocoris]
MFAYCIPRRTAAAARAVLGLDAGQTYTPSDIKKAFRERALTAHPDAGGDVECFRQLQGAYEELLREEGNTKGGASPASAADDGRGCGFYSHPHAQWANDRRTHHQYWRKAYEEEVNMNTNERGSPEHPSNTHYRARPHRPSYGAGLGEEFASARQAQRGRHPNFSTYFFYRPYESDFCNPFSTGFTEEELKQAAREQRLGLLRTIARHTCLWSGLFVIVYMHERNNRVRRATEAREKGYKDLEYWRQLREEESEAKRRHRAPLRLENHWLEAPLVAPLPPVSDERSKGKEATRDAATTAKSSAAQGEKKTRKARRQRALRPLGSGGAGGTQVVSFQGRPFTPNGVRGARNSPPITAKTYAKDVTYDDSDLDWEDEALD